MLLTFLGTRGNIRIASSVHRYHAALLVEADGVRVMIDARRRLARQARRDRAGRDPRHARAPRPLPGPCATARRVRSTRRRRRTRCCGAIRWTGGSCRCAARSGSGPWRSRLIRSHTRSSRPPSASGSSTEGAPVLRPRRPRAGGRRERHSPACPSSSVTAPRSGGRSCAGATAWRSATRRSRRSSTGVRSTDVARAVFTHCGSRIVRLDPRSAQERVERFGEEPGVAASIATRRRHHRDGDGGDRRTAEPAVT